MTCDLKIALCVFFFFLFLTVATTFNVANAKHDSPAANIRTFASATSTRDRASPTNSPTIVVDAWRISAANYRVSHPQSTYSMPFQPIYGMSPQMYAMPYQQRLIFGGNTQAQQHQPQVVNPVGQAKNTEKISTEVQFEGS